MTSADKHRITQLERENASMRRRITFLENHVRPPEIYRASQEEMFAYLGIIWSVGKPPSKQQSRTYLQVAQIQGGDSSGHASQKIARRENAVDDFCRK